MHDQESENRGSVAIVRFFLLSSAGESVQRPPARRGAAPPRIINLITRFSDNDPFRLFPDFSPDIVRDKKGAKNGFGRSGEEGGRIDK